MRIHAVFHSRGSGILGEKGGEVGSGQVSFNMEAVEK